MLTGIINVNKRDKKNVLCFPNAMNGDRRNECVIKNKMLEHAYMPKLTDSLVELYKY